VLQIPCPWCGPRDIAEYTYGGQAGVAYPEDPSTLSPQAWAAWLYVRANPRGPLCERWHHVGGCRRWITIERDTTTQRIAPAGA
jgi:heterotetrameric sarcosine oxidase delta subunit